MGWEGDEWVGRGMSGLGGRDEWVGRRDEWVGKGG